MMAFFSRLHGSTRLLVLLLDLQLISTMPALAQSVGLAPSVPATVNVASPSAPRSVSRSPVALDLGSTSRSLPAPAQLGSGAANINIAGSVRSVTAGTMLTPAERLAVYQVLSTGVQSLLLGTGGNAVGGKFSMGPHFSQYVSSLVVPAGVTGVNLLTTSSTLNLNGNLTNAGNLYVVSSNPALRTANIGAANISNLPGALISSALPATGLPGVTSVVSNLNLNLSAVNDFINAGTIKSSGSLNISAGGSIVNSLPTRSAGTVPVIQSNNDLNLYSGAGHIVNAGMITSLAGNINVASQVTHNILVDNAAGSIIASAGAINLGTPLSTELADISVQGGNLAANNLHLYGRDMSIAVDQLNGTLNMTGSTAHVSACTPDLELGDMNLSGDPTFYNTAGAVTIAKSLVYSGQNLAIVANTNIVSATGAGTIDTSSTTASGGTITLIAGASFTTTGSPGSQGPDSTSTLTINGASGTGGYIDLTGGTGNGTPGTAAIKGLSSKSSALNGSGGNITLASFAGSGANAGAIVLPAAVPISSSGHGTGANGNVLILAGNTNSTAVATGAIVTAGGAAGTGSITVKNAAFTPSGMTIKDGALTGSFIAGAAQSGSVSTGALTAAGADVRLQGGSYLASGAITGGIVQITSASSLKVSGAVTGSTSAIIQAASSILAANLPSVNAPTVSLTSLSGSIGAAGAGNALKVSTANLTANASAASQNVYIAATATGIAPAKVNMLGANSANGVFSLTSTGGINLNSGASITAGSSVLLSAGGTGGSISQADATGTTTIFSPTITLAAGSSNASVGSSSNLIGVAANRSNVSQTVTLAANAAAGSVQIKAVDSLYPANLVNVNLSGSSSGGPTSGIFSLSSTGSISLLKGAKVTDTTGAISLSAGAGQSITQAVATDVTLNTASLTLSADSSGVSGTLGSSPALPLTVTAAKLSATAGSNLWLSNTAAMTAFTAVSKNGSVTVSDKAAVTFGGSSSSPQTFSLTANGLVGFAAGATVTGGSAVVLQTTGALTQVDLQTVNTVMAPSVTLSTGASGIGTSGHALGVASQAAGAAVNLTLTTTGAVNLNGNFPTGGNALAAAGLSLASSFASTAAFNLACSGDIVFPTGITLKASATNLIASTGGNRPGDIKQQTLTAPALLGASVKLSAAGQVAVNLLNPASATTPVSLTAIAGGDVSVQSTGPIAFVGSSSAGANAATGFTLTADGNISFATGAQVKSTKIATKVALTSNKGIISQTGAGASIFATTVVLTSASGIGTGTVPVGTSTTNLYASCPTCSAYLMDTATVNLPAFTVGPTSTYSLLMSGANLDINLSAPLNAGAGGTISLSNPTGGFILNPSALTISAKTIKLSASGGIGAVAAPVLISGCSAPSAVSSAGNVYLSSSTAISSIAGITAAAGKTVSLATTGSQDITLGSSWSNTGGTIILNSSGSLLSSGSSFTVTAGTVDLTAPNGIGTPSLRFGTKAANLTAHSSGGSVYLLNGASANLGSCSTVAGGTFDLLMSAAPSLTLASSLTSGTIVIANPSGTIIDSAGVTLTASKISLTGSAGIGAAGAPVYVSGCSAPAALSSGGSVYLSTNTAVGSMAGVSAGAGKTLSFTTTGSNLSITLGANYSNTGGILILNASGSILNPGAYLLSAGTVSLAGLYGVGSNLAPILSKATGLSANSAAGSVYLQDGAVLNLNSSSAGAGATFSLVMNGTKRNLALTGSVNASPTGTVNIQNATGGLITGTAAGIVTGTNITLSGPAGIGAAGAPVFISGSAAPSILAPTGSIYLSSDTSFSSSGISILAGKTLSLTTSGSGKNITINSSCSNTGGTIIMSASGSVLNAGAYNLTAAVVNLSGATGVGTSGQSILTTTPVLTGNSTGGSVYLQDSASVSLGVSSAGAGSTFKLALSGTNLNMVVAGNVTAGATVDLENTTGGSITNTTAKLLTGASMILAGSAGLGTSTQPLLLSGCSAPQASSASGSVFLSSNSAIGSTAGLSAAVGKTLSITTTGTGQSITIGGNYSNAGGTILMTASGSILDDGGYTLSSGSINLTSIYGVGTGAAPVNISGMAQPGAKATAGSVYLRSNTAITSIAKVTPATGKTLSIATTGAGVDITLAASYLNTGGTVIINSSGSILDAGAYSLGAYNVNLTAANSVGKSSPCFLVSASELTVNASTGNVYLQDSISANLYGSSAGAGQTFSLSMNGAANLTLRGNVSAGASGTIALKNAGLITNSGAWVLTGSTITLSGSNGIGSSGSPVILNGCGTPSVVAAAGSTYLSTNLAADTTKITVGVGKTLSLVTTGSGNNITIGSKFSNSTGAIILDASGAIRNPSSYTLTAGTINLHGVTGVGDVGPDIMISGCAKPTAVSSSGSVYLTSSTSISSIKGITAAAGKVASLTTAGSKQDITIDADYTNSGGILMLDASGSILSKGSYTLFASEVDLTARVSLGSSSFPLLAQSSTPGGDLVFNVISGDPTTHDGGTGSYFIGIPSVGATSTKVLPGSDLAATTQIDDVLANDWNSWTASSGHMITVSEVGTLLSNPSVRGSQAAVLGLISTMFVEPANVDEQGQPLSKSFVQSELHTYHVSQYRQVMSQLNSAHNADDSLSLYGSENAYSGPQMSVIQQGPVGDCYLLAAINGMLNRNPADISHMLSLSGSTISVTFGDGTHKTVTLTDGEIASFNYATNNGCWLAALGQAEAQVVLTGPHASDLSAVDKATPMGPAANGGYSSQTFGMFTGKSYYSRTSLDGDTQTSLNYKFSSGYIDYLLSYGSYNNLPMGVSAPGHALTILSYDGNNVTILNPWGTSGAYDTGLSTPYTMVNGRFTIPLSEMMKGFSAVTMPESALDAAYNYGYDESPAPKMGLPTASSLSSSLAAVTARVAAALPSIQINTQGLMSSTLSSLRNITLPVNPTELLRGGTNVQPVLVTGLPTATQMLSSPASCVPLVPFTYSGYEKGRAPIISGSTGTVTQGGQVKNFSAGSGLSGIMIYDRNGLHSVNGGREGNRSELKPVSHIEAPSTALEKGCVLFAPEHDVCVVTPYAQVSVASGSVALVVVTEKGVAVYNLHDSHSGDVSVSSAQSCYSVDLGRHLMLTPALVTYEEVDPVCCIAHADMETAILPGGSRLFRSNFSLASALSALQPVLAPAALSPKIARQLIKNTAIFMQTRVSSASYRRSDQSKIN